MSRRARPTAAPIARLRALGCRVSTVTPEHAPMRFRYRYSIKMPQGIRIPVTAPGFVGNATAFRDTLDPTRIVVRAEGIDSTRDVTTLLNHIADILEEL